MKIIKQISWRRISQSEIRNSAAGKNWIPPEADRLQARAGKNSFPPTPLPFCPPERLDFKIRNSDSVQKRLEFQPKGTANLQFQNFRKFYAPVVRSPRLRARLKGLILQRFATLRVANKKCFGFGFGSSFVQSTKQNKVLQPIFFCIAFGETWKR